MSRPLLEDDYIVPLLKDMTELASPELIARLHGAAASNPADPRPLVLLAGEYAQGKAYDQAEAALIHALARAPSYAVARFQLGLLQFMSGRPAVAAATWEGLADLPEGHEFRLFQSGLNHLARDQFAEAGRDLRAGMLANVSNAPLNHDIGRLLARIADLGGGAPPDGADGAEPAAEALSEHFLVSAYRNLH